MPMSDYYTCRYRYAAALPMCSCPAMCREMIVATCIDIKKDCKKLQILQRGGRHGKLTILPVLWGESTTQRNKRALDGVLYTTLCGYQIVSR